MLSLNLLMEDRYLHEQVITPGIYIGKKGSGKSYSSIYYYGRGNAEKSQLIEYWNNLYGFFSKNDEKINRIQKINTRPKLVHQIKVNGINVNLEINM